MPSSALIGGCLNGEHIIETAWTLNTYGRLTVRQGAASRLNERHDLSMAHHDALVQVPRHWQQRVDLHPHPVTSHGRLIALAIPDRGVATLNLAPQGADLIVREGLEEPHVAEALERQRGLKIPHRQHHRA